jgi:hypothetical protein
MECGFTAVNFALGVRGAVVAFTGALVRASGDGVGGVRTWPAVALACPKAKVRTAKPANGQPSLFFMVLLSLTKCPEFR